MDSERSRKTKRLIEGLEAFRVLCKQLDFHAAELIATYSEDLKSGDVYDTGETPKRQ
jgi:hypothetical protein